MTKTEIEQAEKDAEKDAEWLSLLLLIFLQKKDKEGAELVRFDAAKGRFYYKGRSVSVKQIRKYLERIENRYAHHLDKITEDLLNGEITIGEWKRSFERKITSSHILAGALALGGIAVAARNQMVQTAINSELRFADEFSEAVRKKKAGTYAQVRARARSYARAAAITFANAELESRKLMGIQIKARRLRRASESCKDCIYWSRRGWIPIQIMPRIGSLTCRHYCRCFIEYR